MVYNFIKNEVDNGNEIYSISVSGPIGGEVGEINGHYLASEIDLFSRLSGADKLRIKINTQGGDVFHALSIFDAIVSSSINIEVVNIGVAASAGSFIFLAAKKENRYMVEHSQFMIHEAHSGKNKSKEALKAIEAFNKSLTTIYQSDLGLEEDNIKSKLKETTWYDASDAVNAGFVLSENVIKTGEKIPNRDDYSINALYKVYNSMLNGDTPNINKFQMNAIYAKLGLQNEASEEAVLNAVVDLQNKVEAKDSQISILEKENNSLKTENLAYKEKEETVVKAQITEIVNKAVTEGKIKAENKTKWEERLSNDFEGSKEIIDEMKVSVANPNRIDNNLNQGGAKAKGFDWYQKNDPNGLAAIKESEPEVYNSMVQEYLNEQKEIK